MSKDYSLKKEALIVYHSFHHQNTLKIAQVFGKKLEDYFLLYFGVDYIK